MADSDRIANAPLMREEFEGEDSEHSFDEIDGSNENDTTSPSTYVWALAFAAGISGLLFGYDTGVISSTLILIESDLGRPLNNIDKSLITSCTSLGALIACPITGLLADRFGRKVIILVTDLLFVIGALWQAMAGNVPGMIFGRTIVGLAVGGGSLIVPLYISELSPSAFRGKLVTLSILFITIGQVVAYLVGYAFSTHRGGWRWIVGLGAAPALLQISLMILLPESPRWLVKVGKTTQAQDLLLRVYGAGNDKAVEEVLQAIKSEVMFNEATNVEIDTVTAENHSQAWLTQLRNRLGELFHVSGNRRALTIACLLQGLQQLCGFNSLMYFSATIFSLLGFNSPTLTSLSIAVANLTCTLVALLIIDRVGRRRILLLSLPVMIIALLACSTAYESLGRPSWGAEPSSMLVTDEAGSPWAIVILIAMIVYVCGYAIGLGNIAWQQSELFPLSVRSLGSSLATMVNWSGNFFIGLTFLPMMEYLTPAWTFAVYAGICGLGWICAWRIYPETKGVELEDMRKLLRDSYGVCERRRRAKIGDPRPEPP